MNDAQAKAVETIGELWNYRGCVYETRESAGVVYMVILGTETKPSGPSGCRPYGLAEDFYQRGTALAIDAQGKTNWTTAFPDNPERRYDR